MTRERSRVLVGSLVHEVLTVTHLRARESLLHLHVVCGNYVSVPYGPEWRTDAAASCLWCVAGSSLHRRGETVVSMQWAEFKPY